NAELRRYLQEMDDAFGAEQAAVARRNPKKHEDKNRSCNRPKLGPAQQPAKQWHGAHTFVLHLKAHAILPAKFAMAAGHWPAAMKRLAFALLCKVDNRGRRFLGHKTRTRGIIGNRRDLVLLQEIKHDNGNVAH